MAVMRLVKTSLLALALMQSLAQASGALSETNPIEKVIEMMSELQQKIIGEGEEAQKVYDEFAEWCEEESKNLQFEIKTAKAEVEDLKATVAKAESDIKAEDEKISQLSGQLSTDEADLKAATEIREKEAADFAAEEKDLVDSVDMLERAISIIEREMQKNPAALVQVQGTASLVDALRLLVGATSISNEDATKLTALLQSQHSSEDGELGAPDPAAYKSQSGGIVQALTELLEDAQSQLDEARKKEKTSLFNYETLKLELEDAIKFANECLDKAQKAKAAAGEIKATAEGDLAVTEKDLAQDIQQLADTHHDCMTKAEDFELETKSRAEELKAIATAKKIVIEATGGAAAQTYSLEQTLASFLQTASRSRLSSGADLANFEAVKFVKDLAKSTGSVALAQLANRMAATARLGAAAGEDPFVKVKGLISEMIERLLKEAEEDAAKKGYCDKEMAETKAKKEDKTEEIEKLSTNIDKWSAESAKLKEEVAVLQKELAELAKSQAEMDKVRKEENEIYVKNSAEMEQGIEGIKLALKVLREYYAKEDKAHASADGAGGGIISMLEVVESDFTKGLSEMNTAEENAAAEYDKVTKENEIAKVTKEQDVKYKTKEAKGLDNSVAEATSDREGVQAELDAVLEYWEKITDECVAKPEPYEERKKRREAEIAGLKEALAILSGEAVLLQKQNLRHRVRVHAHPAA